MPVTNISDRCIKAAAFRVKFKDIFNMNEYYRAIHEWFMEYEWYSTDGSGNPDGKDFFETNYIDKTNPDGSKDMYWWWRLQKIPEDNSYYKYHLDLDFRLVGITPTEVMRDSKKLKVHKGEVEVWVYAYLEFDYNNEWSKHPFLKYFHKVFPNRIFKKDLYEIHKLELYREAYTMQAYMKKWFKLKNFLPYEEITPFYTAQSYPQWKKESQ